MKTDKSNSKTTNIELLDRAIKLLSNGNQAKFAGLTHIKESTLKTWRKREAIPDDKILLINTLIENYELKQDMKKIEAFFDLAKKFQN